MDEEKTEMVAITYEVTEEHAKYMAASTPGGGFQSNAEREAHACREALAARKTKYEQFKDLHDDYLSASEFRDQNFGNHSELMAAAPTMLDVLIKAVKSGQWGHELHKAAVDAIRAAVPGEVADELLGYKSSQ